MLSLKLYCIIACGFHQSRFPLQDHIQFRSQHVVNIHVFTIFNQCPTFAMLHFSPLTGACIGSTGTIFAQRSWCPRDYPPPMFPRPSRNVAVLHISMKKNIQHWHLFQSDKKILMAISFFFAILRWLVPKWPECDITRENPLWILWFEDLIPCCLIQRRSQYSNTFPWKKFQWAP